MFWKWQSVLPLTNLKRATALWELCLKSKQPTHPKQSLCQPKRLNPKRTTYPKNQSRSLQMHPPKQSLCRTKNQNQLQSQLMNRFPTRQMTRRMSLHYLQLQILPRSPRERQSRLR
ncbi:MAG: hypothetical protein IJ860_01770 [Eubacterium sp.]|nr:hypothetical protein [Eubacterium sp.]